MEESVVMKNAETLEKYLKIRSFYYTAFPSPGLWLEEFTGEDYKMPFGRFSQEISIALYSFIYIFHFASNNVGIANVTRL